jgi:biotin-dependent carboxylase-like uncharacterized protein
VVDAVAGVVTIQDLGRPGRMHEGVPPGGPLVPELARAANLGVGNDPGAALLEIVGRLSVRAEAEPGEAPTRIIVAVDDAEPSELAAGAALSIAPSPRTRVRYLAVRGGVAVPVVLGGHGTLLAAGIGGLEGRPLRRGDRLRLGPMPAPDLAEPASRRPGLDPAPTLAADRPVMVWPGPDEHRFYPGAFTALMAAAAQISPTFDRTGLRLTVAPEVARALRPRGLEAPSAPMVRGAIQVTPAGELIVLGPDHPTTGGYPLIGVVARGDQGRLAAMQPGTTVRFAPIEAHAAGGDGR